MPRRPFSVTSAALLIFFSSAAVVRALDDGAKIDTLKDMFARLGQCWRPPALPQGHPGMQITVLFSFQRNGAILGKPRITFQSPEASEADSIAYRTAVMETLQHCTPMPFTESMGGAIAGRPLTMRFDDRRNLPKPIERRACLITTTL
jgi:hypothetical protein